MEDEAINILQNGILVETSRGLVCMSLNDALSSNLNLSVEDLQNLTEQLILQQDEVDVSLQSTNVTVKLEEGAVDSDLDPAVLALTAHNASNIQKIVSLLPVTVNTNNSRLLMTVGETNISDSDTSITTNTSNSILHSATPTLTDTSDQKTGISDVENTVELKLPIKRRGGWPKGRKRKPELLHLPPKAPATGYNLYLNEHRKDFKESPLAFHEITKIIGNRWSRLSLSEKKPYLDKAEEEKKRYREEFKMYKQSGAYQLYLAKKRRKRAQLYNVLSESDMDATDEVDEEDNEELYCRTCDQWFHNLHNKREHLQGRQHQQSVAGEMSRELGSDYDTDCMGNTSSVSFSTSLDESSLDAAPILSGSENKHTQTVPEAISNLFSAISRREKDIKNAEINLTQSKATYAALYQQLCSLRDRESKLRNDLLVLKENEKEMESKVVQLWQVPSWFVTTDFKSGNNMEIAFVATSK